MDLGDVSTALVLLVLLALAFDFMNGFHDAANSIATVVSTLVQRTVPVLDDDTEEALTVRILVEEHIAYPEALQRVLDGGWTVEGRRLVTR